MYSGSIVFVHDTSKGGKLSTRWLCEWPAATLAKAGYFTDLVSYADVLNPSRSQERAIKQADLIIYERHVDDPWLPFLEWAATEKRLILIMDDAYWLAGEETPTYRFWNKNDRLKKLEHVASIAEKVVVPSRKLAERYANGYYKPNRPDFSDPCWSVSPLFSDNVILWGGTQGHLSGMREHPFLEAAGKLCEEGIATLISISGSPQLEEIVAKAVPSAQILNFVPYAEWLKILASATVCACPIGEGYDEYRSWIKALESSAMGTVWVASDSEVYADVEGGVKAGYTVEDWYNAMSYLILNPRERQPLREHGLRWAWRQGLKDNLEEWEEIFNG